MGFPTPPLASPLPPYWYGGEAVCKGCEERGGEAEVRPSREESVVLFELCNTRNVVEIRDRICIKEP